MEPLFALAHIGDDLCLVDPHRLPSRWQRAGFLNPRWTRAAFRFRKDTAFE